MSKWLISISDPFYRAAFWQLITPLYEEMLQTLEAALDPQHPDVAITLNSIAILYCYIEKYEEALPLFERSLKIFDLKIGFSHPHFKQTEKNIEFIKAKMKVK